MALSVTTQTSSVERRLPGGKSKFPGKTERLSVSVTPEARKKLDKRTGEYRFLSASDTVEQLIHQNL